MRKYGLVAMKGTRSGDLNKEHRRVIAASSNYFTCEWNKTISHIFNDASSNKYLVYSAVSAHIIGILSVADIRGKVETPLHFLLIMYRASRLQILANNINDSQKKCGNLVARLPAMFSWGRASRSGFSSGIQLLRRLFNDAERPVFDVGGALSWK